MTPPRGTYMIWFVPPPQSSTPAQTVSAQPPAAAVGEAYFLFIQGRTLEAKGDVPGAIAAYRKAIGLVPLAADVRAELAGLYAREGRAADAIAEGEAALKSEPANREAHRILGFVRSALADNAASQAQRAALVTQAIDHFEKALVGGTRDPGVELTMGKLYVSTNQFPKAIQTLQGFLNDQPGFPEGVLLLVEALDATRQFRQAVAVLEPLVRDEPDLARARTWLAEMYERVGRDADALTQWAELARANPKNVGLRSRYATALVNAGQVDTGRKELLALTSDAPRDISAWYLLAQVETQAGRPEAAEAAAKKISEIDSTDPRGPLALAEVRTARGDHRGAAALLEPLLVAMRAQPASDAYSRVSMELAEALEKSGERLRGVRILEDARGRVPGDIDLMRALAAAYDRDKKSDGAEKLYRELLAQDPEDGMALSGLARLLADLREKLPEAAQLAQRALAAQPDNPAYLNSLGWVLVQQGKPEEGRVVLERAAAASPKDSVVLDHLAESLFQLKRYRDAAAAWDRALAANREGIDVGDVTRKRDRARELAGR
ncbi:MAG: tetratricopeptide repeat protein [Vicinamibacterales bacterium]